MKTRSADSLFDTESIWAILLRIAPPVMLAQLIQAMYNIVDSYFVGQYSNDGLTALSIIYPVQLIVTAIAVGTGVGVNTLMSHLDGRGKHHTADRTAGMGTVLALFSWAVFALLSALLMRPFALSSTNTPAVAEYTVTYGMIVCVGSLGVFLESNWSKVHQARGNMRLPMAAQIAGALTNIVLDPLLIFGLGPIPELGVAGAAYATVAGQVLAAVIVSSGFRRPPAPRLFLAYAARIYQLGYPSIFMQMLFTVYIMALNLILAGFSDAAVTVLGLYYKVQSFFFIPLNGLQTCIVPLLSYTYAKGAYSRCQRVVKDSIVLAMVFMLVGIACFELIPAQLLGLFTSEPEVFAIGPELSARGALPDLPGVLPGHRGGAAQYSPLPDPADLLPDPRILVLLPHRPVLCLVCLPHCGGHNRHPRLDFLRPARPHLGTAGAGRADRPSQRSSCYENDHGNYQQAGQRRGVRRPHRGGLLFHPHVLHGRLPHRRKHHPAHRHPGGAGAPGYLHHPGALLPPDGEDLLQCAAGHAVRPLPHRGHGGRGHPVRIRRDPV